MSQVLDELGISLDHELSDIIPGLEKPHVAQAAQVCVCVCVCVCMCTICMLLASIHVCSMFYYQANFTISLSLCSLSLSL